MSEHQAVAPHRRFRKWLLRKLGGDDESWVVVKHTTYVRAAVIVRRLRRAGIPAELRNAEAQPTWLDNPFTERRRQGGAAWVVVHESNVDGAANLLGPRKPMRLRNLGEWEGQSVVHDDFGELPDGVAATFRGERV